MTPLPGGGRAQSPGPWRWEDYRQDDGSWHLVAANGDSVLRVYVRLTMFTMAEEADTALIAAAPQLLAIVAEVAEKERCECFSGYGPMTLCRRCRASRLLSSLSPPKVTP